MYRYEYVKNKSAENHHKVPFHHALLHRYVCLLYCTTGCSSMLQNQVVWKQYEGPPPLSSPSTSLENFGGGGEEGGGIGGGEGKERVQSNFVWWERKRERERGRRRDESKHKVRGRLHYVTKLWFIRYMAVWSLSKICWDPSRQNQEGVPGRELGSRMGLGGCFVLRVLTHFYKVI